MFNLNGTSYAIPDWILDKNLSDHERYAWQTGDTVETLKRETEKAVLVECNTDFGRVSCWCPKSVLVTEEQLKAEREAAAKAWDNGLRYNEYLRETAAANGVKLGNARRTVAIIDKLEAKGIEFMDKAAFLAA